MQIKKSLHIVLLIICCTSRLTAYCNDSLIHRILLRLADIQINHDPYFAKGLYPAYREYELNKTRVKKDDNIYYAGLVAFALRTIRPQLTAEDKVLSDSIFARLAAIAPRFTNQKGRNTYNFWPTDRPKIFPNSGWLNRYDKKLALADDMDDTAIMLMALAASQATVQQVHKLMQQFTNNSGKRAKTALRSYNQFDTYSTWFGKKMVVELDACVLTNILCMVQVYNQPWTKTDSASLAYLVKMCATKDYLLRPGKVAVIYKTTPIILYHLARLMSIKKIPALDEYTADLIASAIKVYNNTCSITEKVMMRTALLRWGYSLPADVVTTGNLLTNVEQDSYVFFIANLASTMPRWAAFTLYNLGLTRFNYYCPAHNDVLLLEYLAEQKKFDAVKPPYIVKEINN